MKKFLKKLIFRFRRKTPRVRSVSLLKIYINDEVCITGNIRDLSLGGLRFLTTHAFRKNEIIRVQLYMSRHSRVIDAKACVLWCRPLSEKNVHMAGASFTQINANDESFIKQVTSHYGEE